MRSGRTFYSALIAVASVVGCAHSNKPFVAFGSRAPQPMVVDTDHGPQAVATSDLGTVTNVPGLAPKPKPFIAVPKPIQVSPARPSTLLLEHASPDSPVPLSDYGKQPVFSVGDFHLRWQLSVDEVQTRMGLPAQLADCDDPWWVYRLNNDREVWLHFVGPYRTHLEAADVIRGAEDGYVRDRVFSANGQ